ncbi:MAG: hypothetical protein U1F67_10410 [Rubrivivax sp.]
MSQTCIAIKEGVSEGHFLRTPQRCNRVTLATTGEVVEQPETFEMPDGAAGTWFVPLDKDGFPMFAARHDARLVAEFKGRYQRHLQVLTEQKAAAQAHSKYV